MPIGSDIAEVMDELGITATILRSPSNIKEKITYDVNTASTNYFATGAFLNTSFRYNTKIIVGDLLQFGESTYLVISSTPDIFEGGIVEYVGSVLKCNTPATTYIARYFETQDPDSYVITAIWTVESDVMGLIYADTRGVVPSASDTGGMAQVFKLECYIPGTIDVQINDRLILTVSEYYTVQNIEKFRIPGISILTLIADTRVQ
jgi:hypothetical protein